MSTVTLYTPEILALATGLADHPWDDALPLKGEARSKTCGSSIALALSTDEAGRIERVGLRSYACAIGQAAAAIFARGAKGSSAADISRSTEEITAWLQQGGRCPDWPGLDVLAPARDYPGRHGAIMLAWQAARDLLSSE